MYGNISKYWLTWLLAIRADEGQIEEGKVRVQYCTVVETHISSKFKAEETKGK
jgi:hypothetical protein